MNPLLLDKNPPRQSRYRPTLNRQASRYALNSDMEGGCPCPLGGNGCDPCFEVNIAQRMALGHSRKVIEGECRCRGGVRPALNAPCTPCKQGCDHPPSSL